MSYIDNVLKSIKHSVNYKGETQVKIDGEFYILKIEFNKPASTQEINVFEQVNNIILPVDYKDFLVQHNGAEMYRFVDDNGKITGGGLHLFSLDEISEVKSKVKNVEPFNGAGILIGHLLEDCYLCIDPEKALRGSHNYLNMLEFIEVLPISYNFERFLEKYVEHNGEVFWH
ncbi:SMI1/KNR4 family protein [Metabacillus indicus]|uniref:SMI1/KNR4 family protein n=1 Tax=Metabacillus indicus TaxID=246786 RepID=UPI003983F11B